MRASAVRAVPYRYGVFLLPPRFWRFCSVVFPPHDPDGLSVVLAARLSIYLSIYPRWPPRAAAA